MVGGAWEVCLPPTLASRAHLGWSERCEDLGGGWRLEAAAPGPRRTTITPPPIRRDLTALLGPGTGVCFRGLEGACSARWQEPGVIGRRVGQHESCQKQGLFL